MKSHLNNNIILQEAIIKTLSYGEVFAFPMTSYEIWKFLIHPHRASKKLVEQELSLLLRKKIIHKEDAFYFLSSRQLVVSRRLRKKMNQEKLKKAKRVAFLLSLIPCIRLIGLSGSLSVNNACDADDIDFFIITQKNSLWISRFLTTVVLFCVGQKRTRGAKDVKDKVCLNMFLSETQLVSSQKNLYIAHEIAQLRVLVDKNKAYEQFLTENIWAKKYLPNSFQRSYMIQKRGFGFVNLILFPLEVLFYALQYLYMRKYITRETIQKDKALFHPIDRESFILKQYEIHVSNFLLSLQQSPYIGLHTPFFYKIKKRNFNTPGS